MPESSTPGWRAWAASLPGTCRVGPWTTGAPERAAHGDRPGRAVCAAGPENLNAIATFSLPRFDRFSGKPQCGKPNQHPSETKIRVKISLDGSDSSQLNTGIGSSTTMLDQIARHGAFDLDRIRRRPAHRRPSPVEDVGITLARPLRRRSAMKGLTRYGHAYVPLGKPSRVVVDLSTQFGP